MRLDANCWLGHWPFDDIEPDTTRELVAHQAALGFNLSCVASLDAVFRRDPFTANERLFRELRSNATLDPVAVVNPSLANWRDSLTHLVEQLGCRQLRLVPNYHLYDLSEPGVDALLDRAVELGVKVGIQMRLEDERQHHPLMQVPGVPLAQVADLAARRDETFLLLCCYRNEALALAAHENLLFGLSHLEYLDTIASLVDQVTIQRLVLASHTPLLVTRAAMAKLEQFEGSAEDKQAIAGGNLAGWLGGDPNEIPWPEEDR